MDNSKQTANNILSQLADPKNKQKATDLLSGTHPPSSSPHKPNSPFMHFASPRLLLHNQPLQEQKSGQKSQVIKKISRQLKE